MSQKNTFRIEIEDMIEAGDLVGLQKKAGELHGHFCNYLTYGVIAGYYGMKKLGVQNTGMEEIVAIIETNNCFSDGVQMITGCTFGNNALIYRDYGKTAVTLCKRDGNAIRFSLKPEFEDSRAVEFPEAYELFNKLVTCRKVDSPDEFPRMMQLFAEMAVVEIHLPAEEVFKIEEMQIKLPEFAPIFDSVKCTKCHENIMKTRAIEKDGQFFCIPCADANYHELNGSGIVRN